VVTQNETFKLGGATNLLKESHDTAQSMKTLFTILQTKKSQNSERERERDDRMGSTEKMTNNAGNDGSTLLVPKAKTSGKRYIIQVSQELRSLLTKQ
jgi:hypothetical protein